MLKAVIFDMDGVIIDSEPLWRRAMIRVFNASGLPFTDNDCRITTGMRIDQVISFWNKKTPFTYDEDLVKTHIEDHLCGLIAAEGKPMKGLQQALDIIAKENLMIALATSSSKKLIDCVLKVLKIESYFKHIQSAEDLKYGKPHPEVFLKCAEAIDTNPNDCLVIEDSLNGIISAKAAGMSVIAIPDEHNINNQKFCIADITLHSLQEINLEIIKRF
jgi:mannitol-1-/sugar-/sorbitol-6-/2-deoxyglucose-6-phosphatase